MKIELRSQMLKAIVLTTLCCTAPSAMATSNLWCVGQITRLYIDTNTSLLVWPTWRGDYVMVCNLDASWNGVAPNVCKNWLALLQGAHHAGSTTTIYYANRPETACSDLATYSGAPGPGYVMLRE